MASHWKKTYFAVFRAKEDLEKVLPSSVFW